MGVLVYSQSEMMLKRPNDVLLVAMVLVYSQSEMMLKRPNDVLLVVMVLVYSQSEMTTAAMEVTCEDVVDIVIFLNVLDQGEDTTEKRDLRRGWKASAGINPGGGVNVGVSYSWRR